MSVCPSLVHRTPAHGVLSPSVTPQHAQPTVVATPTALSSATVAAVTAATGAAAVHDDDDDEEDSEVVLKPRAARLYADTLQTQLQETESKYAALKNDYVRLAV